jgi:SAM-dependent methyltransferase
MTSSAAGGGTDVEIVTRVADPRGDERETDERETGELFDEPSLWRVRAIERLQLDGDDRCAGAATSSGLPQLLLPAVPHVRAAPPGIVLDVGGGLGAVSEWLRRTCKRRVVPIDVSATSCRIGRRLFPSLGPLCAFASALPIRSDAVPIAIANGVISLVNDLSAALDELERVTHRGGILVIADLVAQGPVARLVDDVNHFWSLDAVCRGVEARGGAIVRVAVAEEGDWSSTQALVANEIRRTCAHRVGFDAWLDDQHRIGALRADGLIAPGALIARWRT